MKRRLEWRLTQTPYNLRINQMKKEVIDMVVKAAIGTLKSMSDAQLIVTVQNVIAGVTDNPKYPTPLPTPAALTTALNAFTVALADAANGGTELTAIKNAKRTELVSLMTQLAAYITVTANGDLPTLLSSNFPIQKPSRTPVGPVAAPGSPTLKQGGVSGTMIASVSPVFGASTYNWSLALASAPDKSVQTAQTVGGRVTFDGVTAGEDYSVSVNAVGAAGTSDWSDASTLIVI